MPKLKLDSEHVDCRVLVVDGAPRFTVVRQSQHPITNLHLGGRRGDLAQLKERVGVAVFERALDACAQVAKASRLLSCRRGCDVRERRSRLSHPRSQRFRRPAATPASEMGAACTGGKSPGFWARSDIRRPMRGRQAWVGEWSGVRVGLRCRSPHKRAPAACVTSPRRKGSSCSSPAASRSKCAARRTSTAACRL